MDAPDRTVAGVASAILNGTPVDWAAVESGATPDDRALLEELRVLESIAGRMRDAAANGGAVHPAAPAGYWGRLRLIEPVGRGSFGEVYRAWDAQLQREVALKLMPVATEDASAILDEGRLLARIRHPGVVTVYDVEVRGAWAGLCMEYIDGETLEERVRRDGPLGVAASGAIGLQLCAAVAAVHDAGVLHRDVKAANVVLQGDERATLTDFGAGRRADRGIGADLTGTPLYLAPEVLAGGGATAQSDIYSLGVLLHLALTGRLPVTGTTLTEVRQAHARRSSGSADGRRWPSAVPKALAAVVDRAIDANPERRYDTARAMAAALREAVPTPAPRRRWRVAAAAAVVGIALVGGWGWRAGREPNPAGAAPIRIAVLPFTGPVADGDTAARDELTRDLMAHLQTFGNARVTGGTSAQTAVALGLPAREAGVRLGAGVVITGQVAVGPEAAVAHVTVTRTADGGTVWARDYRQEVATLLRLPQRIGDDVAAALDLQRRPEPHWNAANRDAHSLYIRGQSALDRVTPEGARLALQLFERSLALDPGHAGAHAAMAGVFLRQLPSIPHLSAGAALARAEASATRALELDPALPEAYIAVAAIRQARRDRRGAEQAFRRAIELDPSNVRAREQYSQWLSLFGRFAEALEHALAAEALDPLSPRALMGVASAYRFARRYDLAVAQAEKARALDPTFPGVWLNLGHNYLGLGRVNDAIDAYQRMGRRSGNLGHALAVAGRTAEARTLALEFEAQYAETGLGAGDAAQIYSGLGEIDRAFYWLERMDDVQAGLPTLKVAAVWDPLRGDPRFPALLARYGLAD